MNIWKNRYGKRAQLYKKLNHQFDFDNYKRNNINNNPTVKRTNSILKMKEKNHISFTENNNNKYILPRKIDIPVYYNTTFCIFI